MTPPEVGFGRAQTCASYRFESYGKGIAGADTLEDVGRGGLTPDPQEIVDKGGGKRVGVSCRGAVPVETCVEVVEGSAVPTQ